MTEPNDMSLPDRIRDRLEALETQGQRIISAARDKITAAAPGTVSFRYQAVLPGRDILLPHERAQSLGFVTRYEALPDAVGAQVVVSGERLELGNLDFLRHTLNEYRTIVMNERDSVYYRKLHSTWRAMLLRPSVVEGTIVRVLDATDKDVTAGFVQWLDQTQSAIKFIINALELDYLYNGILQHCDERHSERFLQDYLSGELNYIMLKSAGIITAVKDHLEPYYRLANALTFPELGPL